MRRVISIPTLHGISETYGGASPEKVAAVADRPEIAERGRIRDQKISEYIERYWDVIEKRLEAQGLEPSQTRVYPETTFEPLEGELPYIQRSADRGNRQSKLVLRLVDKGMKYEPAESQEFQEKQGKLMDLGMKVHLSRLRARNNPLIWDQRSALIKKIYDLSDEEREKRDREAASRINQTLQDNETGILLFGANHNIQHFLDPDINFYSLKGEINQDIEDFDEFVRAIKEDREVTPKDSESKG